MTIKRLPGEGHGICPDRPNLARPSGRGLPKSCEGYSWNLGIDPIHIERVEQMTQSKNVDAIRAFDRLMRESRHEEAAAYLDPEFVIVEPMSLPYGGTFRGRAGFLEMRRIFDETWSEFDRGDWWYTEGGDVVARSTVATIRSRATGRSMEFPLAETFEMRAGKMLNVTPFYFDTHALIALTKEE